MAAVTITDRDPLVRPDGRPTRHFIRFLQELTDRTGGSSGSVTASSIAFSPTGDLAATNVQQMGAELSSEKATVVALTAHTGNTSNPHSVTKTQVGLGNVDNTSDANKPVSTAQAAADAAAQEAAQAYSVQRSNHTGTQTASTISDFGSAADLRVRYFEQVAETSKGGAATLTIAELLTGIIQYTGAVGNLTMPLGTDIELGISPIAADRAFEFSVINTGSGTATIATAVGLTLVGAMGVATSTSAMFRVRKTAINTYTVYRVS